jgi:hypothetical protein
MGDDDVKFHAFLTLKIKDLCLGHLADGMKTHLPI